MEAVSTVEEGKEEANYDDDDGDDNAGSNSKVDEEELIKTKSPYEKQFIRHIGPSLVRPSIPRDLCIAPP